MEILVKLIQRTDKILSLKGQSTRINEHSPQNSVYWVLQVFVRLYSMHKGILIFILP